MVAWLKICSGPVRARVRCRSLVCRKYVFVFPVCRHVSVVAVLQVVLLLVYTYENARRIGLHPDPSHTFRMLALLDAELRCSMSVQRNR